MNNIKINIHYPWNYKFVSYNLNLSKKNSLSELFINKLNLLKKEYDI